jgi:hypothetical protein
VARTAADAPIGGNQALLESLRRRTQSLRDRYRDDPLGLAERLGLLLPEKPVKVMERLGVYDPERHGPIEPGLRDLVLDVCTGKVESAVAVANRGGGKSFGVSFIEFFLVFVRDFDALNLGGSELQADQVYQYILRFVESDKEWRELVKGESVASKTTTTKGAWIRVLTASQKSVRSPHAGGKKPDGRIAGGVLVIDEEAEAAPDIVAAALPTINTAIPSVNVRASTFHNAEGSFKEVVDNAEDMGYTKYGWNIFDVAQKCGCTDGCQSEEECFKDDHWEDYLDPDTGQPTRRLLHRAYCGGRAMYAQGWIPMTEIVKLWKRGKRNHSTWEVEAMGSRPSSKGFVIRDLHRFGLNVVDKPASDFFMDGFPISICVDWGVRAAGLEVWQEQPGGRHVLLESEQLEEAGANQITGAILAKAQRYGGLVREVAADIGGGGNYMNKALIEEHRLPVREVNFAEQKEAAAAAMNVFSESNQMVVPKEHTIFLEQINRWKRDGGGRIQKGNDHMCDAAVCYFSRFIEELGLSHVRVPPRSARSAPVDREHPSSAVAHNRVSSGRVAVIRTLGSRSRSR